MYGLPDKSPTLISPLRQTDVKGSFWPFRIRDGCAFHQALDIVGQGQDGKTQILCLHAVRFRKSDRMPFQQSGPEARSSDP